MPTPKLTDADLKQTAKLFYDNGKSIKKGAAAGGFNYATFSSRVRNARDRGYITDSAELDRVKTPKVVEATVVVKPNYRIQQRKSKPDETKRVLAIGDSHDGPSLPDKTRFYAMGRFAKENKVDEIVHIGDFATCDSLNRFDRNDTLKGKEKPSFKKTWVAFKGPSGRFIRVRWYDVKKHVTLGNHEPYMVYQQKPEVVELLDQLLFATLDDYGWTYSLWEFYFIGDAGFTHAPLNTMGKAYGGMRRKPDC